MRKRSMLKNEKGFALITFAMIMSTLLAFMFMAASNKTDHVLRRHSVTQSISYADQISFKFAQKIRYAYDLALIGACPAAAPAFVLTGGLTLCLPPDRRICVPHPRDSRDVCIEGNVSLLAKRERAPGKLELIVRLLKVDSAQAETGEPPAPSILDTSNALGAALPAGACLPDVNCQITCAAATRCVTFRFCPLLGNCNADEFVWQTIALLR